MVETGAKPKVSFVRRQVTRIGRVLTNPLLPDDYFALLNPNCPPANSPAPSCGSAASRVTPRRWSSSR